MLEKLFRFKNEKGEDINIIDIILGGSNAKDYIYTMAEAKAINLIAKTIAKTELQVYAKNKENGKIEKVKDDLYWRLNIQPNYYENGTEFAYKLATKLLVNKKALIIMDEPYPGKKMLHIADSFKASNTILYEKYFSDVVISDNEDNRITMQKNYNINNSIYLSIPNQFIKTASETYKVNSSKILNTVQKKYIKSNSLKWKLKKPRRKFTT
ncbi:MAG: phage portal protein [Clostridia bacterium]|nr:phage portal protein [Clostridia bacterium]